jgi:hypothetical protein
VLLTALILGNATGASPDPDAANRLRVLLWAGVVVLALLFGLVLLLTVIRLVRRRYFRHQEAAGARVATPWQEAGQRVRPVEGGELIEGATPDDDPEGYRRQVEQQSDDPNDDTGPLPDDDEDDDRGW